MQEQNHRSGILAGIAAYIIWGVLPLYWKLFDQMSAIEILAHRIIWSLVFIVILLSATRQLQPFWKEVKMIFSTKKTAVGICLASLFISINWLLFIWAVNNDHIIEASLGYYINPLTNVLLGFLFLKERFTRLQGLSFVLAAIGVTVMTLYYGVVPWVSLVLAASFGFYGLMKKVVNAGALFGLTLETLIVTPLALTVLFLAPSPLVSSGVSVFTDPIMTLLLFGSGVATAVPLLLFATATRRISLSLVGFLQYIGPTIMLFIGIFLYQEPFHYVQFIAFLFIWTGLIIFTVSSLKTFRKTRVKAPPITQSKEKSLL